MCGLYLLIGVSATELHPLLTYRYLIGTAPSPSELINRGVF